MQTSVLNFDHVDISIASTLQDKVRNMVKLVVDRSRTRFIAGPTWVPASMPGQTSMTRSLTAKSLLHKVFTIPFSTIVHYVPQRLPNYTYMSGIASALHLNGGHSWRPHAMLNHRRPLFASYIGGSRAHQRPDHDFLKVKRQICPLLSL